MPEGCPDGKYPVRIFGTKVTCIDLPVSDDPETTWSDLSLPDWLKGLKGVSDRLVSIAKNPEGFVLGAMLSLLLSGFLGVLREIVRALRILTVGSGVGYESGDLVGIEDIPLVLWSVLDDPLSSAGGAVIDVAAAPSSWAADIAQTMGIVSYPVTVAMYVLILAIGYELLTRTSRATLAAVPVVGSFLEEFIYG